MDETEKVNLEVGATQSGRLVRIERKQGETAKIGDVLAVIEETAGPKAGAEKPQAIPSPLPEKAPVKDSPRPRSKPVQDAQAAAATAAPRATPSSWMRCGPPPWL